MDGLMFQLGEFRVRIASSVLRTFDAHRQSAWYHREAGGQLFGNIEDRNWTIIEATGVRKKDRRGRFNFWPNRIAEQQEILAYHARGLDYMGDWHTHPQDQPSPSSADLASINNIVKCSTHHLPGFLLCIVGLGPFPTGLWVSFHSRGGETIAASSV